MRATWFFRGCSLLLVIQTAVYWGYRMGARSTLHQEQCIDFRVRKKLQQILTTNPTDQIRGATNEASDNPPNNRPRTIKHGIVLTSQCSGSEWLVSNLNAIEGVEWQLERMIHYSDHYMDDEEWEQVPWSDYKRDLENAFRPESAILADIERANQHDDDDHVDDTAQEGPSPKDVSGKLNKHNSEDPNPLVMKGFKLMYDQIPQHLRKEFAQWLTDNHVYVIHLRRGCAVLQFASHMDKFMHARRHGLQEDHVYKNGKNITTRAKPPKDWYLTLEDTDVEENRWLRAVERLEENQSDFAKYLHVHAAKVPVFEVTYENLDGPFHDHWLRALVAFLDLPHPSASTSRKKKTTIKTGARQCEERIQGLGGPNLTTLDGTRSQIECLRLRSLAKPKPKSKSAKTTTTTVNIPASTMLGLPRVEGRCRLAPHCNQTDYGVYLESVMVKANPGFVPAINVTRHDATLTDAAAALTEEQRRLDGKPPKPVVGGTVRSIAKPKTANPAGKQKRLVKGKLFKPVLDGAARSLTKEPKVIIVGSSAKPKTPKGRGKRGLKTPIAKQERGL